MRQETIEPAEPAQASACLNCGALLAGPHCHGCGQKALVHRGLGAFLHDLAHSVLHLEGKLWRTLPLLAWRPGLLTRRYVEGERARFVSPLAAFLFSVFLMFAAFGLLGGPLVTTPYSVRIGAEYLYYIPTVGTAEERLRGDRDELAAYRARLVENEARPDRVADAEHAIATMSAAIAVLERGRASAPAAAPVQTASEGAPRTVSLGALFGWMFRKVGENPPLVAAEVQNKAYKFSWALIPISVPFLWLLLIGNPRNRLYDHTVFVTYSLSFVTLLLVLMTVARPLGLLDMVALPFPFIVAWHMFRQLKGAYALSFLGALWRSALLLVFALVASFLFVSLLVIAA